LEERKMSVLVLAVDDDADVRYLAAETLRNDGFDVVEACDASSAVAQLGEHPDVDVLFTDIEMPGSSGFALAIMAVLLSSRVHVLYTSGQTTINDRRCELAIPAMMLAKPYRAGDLVSAVRATYGTPLGVRGSTGLPAPRSEK
jgi:CheY-like chemotaxis protein